MIAQIKGSTGNLYEINDMGKGLITCTCKDFQYRHAVQGGFCKHIALYVELCASTSRVGICARARAAKQAKRAGQIARAAKARAARALKHAGISNWREHVLETAHGAIKKATCDAPRDDVEDHDGLAVNTTWRESCAGAGVIQDSYRKYKSVQVHHDAR
jgi:hypothetical protein